MVWENWESLIVPDNYGATFANFYNEFLKWFTSLDTAGQIISGLLIILGLVLFGYMVYGILWLAYQITKVSIIGTILLLFLMYMVTKLVIVAFIDEQKVKEQWTNSVENMRWFIGVAYPSTVKNTKKVEKPITEQSPRKVYVPEPPKIFHLKEDDSQRSLHLYCPTCGVKFTDRMTSVMISKKMTFCESCGQQFISPNEIFV